MCVYARMCEMYRFLNYSCRRALKYTHAQSKAEKVAQMNLHWHILQHFTKRMKIYSMEHYIFPQGIRRKYMLFPFALHIIFANDDKDV